MPQQITLTTNLDVLAFFFYFQLSDVDAGGATVFLDLEEVVYPRKVCGIQGFVLFVRQRNKIKCCFSLVHPLESSLSSIEPRSWGQLKKSEKQWERDWSIPTSLAFSLAFRRRREGGGRPQLVIY